MEYNGHGFKDGFVREKTKYIVVTDGDLDLNGAYGIESDIELQKFISESKEWGTTHKIQAIFKVESDVTSLLHNLENLNIKFRLTP